MEGSHQRMKLPIIPLAKARSSSTEKDLPLAALGEMLSRTVKEESDTCLASQLNWTDPGDQWDDRCPSRIAPHPDAMETP